ETRIAVVVADMRGARQAQALASGIAALEQPPRLERQCRPHRRQVILGGRFEEASRERLGGMLVMHLVARGISRRAATEEPHRDVASSLMRNTARKASCGISTLPTSFSRFLPSFCFSRSLRLRVMSPP